MINHTIDSTTPVRRNPRIAYRATGDGGVLLNLDTGSYHSINATGRMIWESLGSASTAEDVRTAIQALQPPEDVEPDELLEDVVTFLAALFSRDAVILAE